MIWKFICTYTLYLGYHGSTIIYHYWPSTMRCTRLRSTLLSLPNLLFPSGAGRLALSMASRSFCFSSFSFFLTSASCLRFSAISISLEKADLFGFLPLGRRRPRSSWSLVGGWFSIACRSGCRSKLVVVEVSPSLLLSLLYTSRSI